MNVRNDYWMAVAMLRVEKCNRCCEGVEGVWSSANKVGVMT